MKVKHYLYRGFRLTTSGNSLGFICFVNENDPLIRPVKTERKALSNGKKLVDLFWEDEAKAGRPVAK